MSHPGSHAALAAAGFLLVGWGVLAPGGAGGGPRPAHAAAEPIRPALQRAPAGTSIQFRRGWNLDVPLRTIGPDESGVPTVHAEELDRLELHVGTARGDLSGFLWNGAQYGPLPAGATLDGARGVLSWQPGAGFVGMYHFAFLEGDGENGRRVDVRVVLHPKNSGRVGPQGVIDIPRAGETVGSRFVVAGWAVDLDDAAGAGVDLVQVWAQPHSGGPRILLGSASYGGRRRDVASLYGDRFAASGFGLEANGLAPGAYDIGVVARSVVSGALVPLGRVTVTVQRKD
jgi:hypothetical protein